MDTMRADIDRRLGHTPATAINGNDVEADLERLSAMAGLRP